MRLLSTLFLTLSISTFLTAQTFYLKFEEVTRNATTFEVDVFIAISDTGSGLGSSNLQFDFPSSVITNPSLVSHNLTPTAYDAVNIKPLNEEEVSLNISLAIPENGDVIAQYPSWTNVARVGFDVISTSGGFALNWLYNGGSTQTIVFEEDESTSLPVAAPSNDLIDFNGSILPVELSYFTTEWENTELQQHADLEWITQTEQNSAFFRIQRSFDGQTWKNVAQLEAAGNSIAQQSYQWEDNNVGTRMPGSYAYYRLKQVDTDGSSGYSEVRVLERRGSQQPSLSLRPNPAEDIVQIQGNLSNEGPLQIRLLDLNGQVHRELVLENGLQPGFQLNVQDLPAGVYFLDLRNGSKGIQRKLIKQ